MYVNCSNFGMGCESQVFSQKQSGKDLPSI